MKPEIMDGVPNKHGPYLMSKNTWNYWVAVNVVYCPFNEGFGAYFDKKFIPYEDFGKYSWSERIEPPEGE